MSFEYLSSAEMSDIGRQRRRNEDATLVLAEYGVFAVFDGMGGASGGGEASQTAKECLRRAFAKNANQPASLTSLKGRLMLVRNAMNEASREIRERADALGVTGAGTTAAIMIFDDAQPDRAVILHAGDSRVYRFRDGALTQLTRDHSFAVAAGVASERSLPPMFRGVVTRAVGLETSIVLDETPVDCIQGDTFMLCTDGLSKMLADAAMSQLFLFNSQTSLQTLAAILVDEANNVGGLDNISVILIGESEGDHVATDADGAAPVPHDIHDLDTELVPAIKAQEAAAESTRSPMGWGALAAALAVALAVVLAIYYFAHLN